MKTSNYTVQVIEPSEGFLLTQKDEANIEKMSFYSKLFLASTDSVDNYKEISIADADEIKAKQRALFEDKEKTK